MDWKRIILQKDKIYYDNFKVYLQYIITFFKIQYQSTINLLNLHLLFMTIYIYIYIYTHTGETGIGKTKLGDRVRVYRQHIRQPEYQKLKVEEHLRTCGKGNFKIFPLL